MYSTNRQSRLPIATSVRRPTSLAKGSTSFIGAGLNRASGIPSTTRKYAQELFTPQTKTPRAHFGASTAGKSFRSVVATEKKYKKPLPEREELQQMFDNLLAFLKARAPNLPLPEAKKFFSSVSTTESTRIFQLLFNRISLEFKINRLEVDVPEVLASLDYPYIRSVTKSSLVSVTSRTAATSLLVIFDWLIKYIQDTENFDGMSSTADSDGDELTQACRNTLTEPEGGCEANYKIFEKLYPIEDVESCRLERVELVNERDTIATDLEGVNEFLQEKQTLEEDSIRCEEYKAQMEKYLECKIKEAEEVAHQRLRVRLQTDEINKKLEVVELGFKNQELTEEEVIKDEMMSKQLTNENNTLLKEQNELLVEIEELTAKERGLIDNYSGNIGAILNEIKKLHELYDNCHKNNLESATLVERRKVFGDWITRLNQLPPNDVAQIERVFHDICLCMQKIEATETRLEAEICDKLSSEKLECEKLLTSNIKCEKELIPRLQEANKREENEVKVEKVQLMDALAKIEAEREEKRRQLSTRLEVLEKEREQLERQQDLEIRRKDTDTKESVQMMELDEQHLKIVLDKNEKEESNIHREIERDAKLWREARLVVEANYKTVREAHKLLRKRFGSQNK